MQYARVPIELVELVDSNAIQLYVVLCKYAGRNGRCWPSNARLAADTRQSERQVIRALNELAAVRAIHKRGRARRTITVAFVSDGVVTYDDAAIARLSDTGVTSYVTPVSDGTRTKEPDTAAAPLRDAAHDESEQQMTHDDDALFEIEPVEKPQRELSVVAECMRAYFDAYGTQSISRSMIARIGKRFKDLSDTYSRDELVMAARQLGEQRIANPNAVEPFVLRLRSPQQQQQTTRSQWSALATDTLSQLPSPFGEQRSV